MGEGLLYQHLRAEYDHGKPVVGPSSAVTFALASLFLAYLYTVFRDFAASYIKPPSHMPSLRWLISFPRSKVDFPLVQVDGEDYKGALYRGAREYPDQPFRFQHFPQEWVVLPPRHLDEVKSIPFERLNFQEANWDFLVGFHTSLSNLERVITGQLRSNGNKIVDSTHDVVAKATADAISKAIGPCEEWTEIALQPKFLEIVLRVQQRVFVGAPLCESKEWLDAVITTSKNSFGAVPTLWEYPAWMRPFAAWRSAGLKASRAARNTARRLLKPHIEGRLSAMKEPGFEPPLDLIQMAFDGTMKTGEGTSVEWQVDTIFGVSRIGMHPVATAMYRFMYDLALRPEHMEPLREEARQVSQSSLTRVNVQNMPKMDSFLQESQRLAPFFHIGNIRKCLEDITLSDGTFLPQGTYTCHVRDSIYEYPDLSNPDEFDGMRWHRLRQVAGNEKKHTSTQPSAENNIYGMGTQSCPGRFFAMHQLRVIMIQLLLDYDIELAEPPSKEEPIVRTVRLMCATNPNIQFRIRKRKEH